MVNPCLSASALCSFVTSPKLTISVPRKNQELFHFTGLWSNNQTQEIFYLLFIYLVAFGAVFNNWNIKKKNVLLFSSGLQAYFFECMIRNYLRNLFLLWKSKWYLSMTNDEFYCSSTYQNCIIQTIYYTCINLIVNQKFISNIINAA